MAKFFKTRNKNIERFDSKNFPTRTGSLSPTRKETFQSEWFQRKEVSWNRKGKYSFSTIVHSDIELMSVQQSKIYLNKPSSRKLNRVKKGSTPSMS